MKIFFIIASLVVVARATDRFVVMIDCNDNKRSLGAIIAKDWVVTSRNSSGEKLESCEVKTGNMWETHSLKVDKIVEHESRPKVEDKELKIVPYSIVLMHVEQPLPDTVQEIALPSKEREIKPQSTALSTTYVLFNDFFKNEEVTFMDTKECNSTYYEDKLPEGHFCLYGYIDSQYECVQNRGEPLVINEILVGIATNSQYRCNTFKYPKTFIDLGHFRNWIDRQIKP